LLRHTEHEYRIVSDARRERNLEIFSVDEVVSVTTGSLAELRYEPYFSFRHGDTRPGKQAFWHARRREPGWHSNGRTSEQRDPRPQRSGEQTAEHRGTDMYLSVMDLSGRPVTPDVEALTVRLTCSNRDLPSMLPFGTGALELELEGGGPIRRVVALEKPSPSLPPP